MARRFSQFKVGNGKSISLWYDRWNPDGAQYDVYGHRIVMILGVIWMQNWTLF